jgi:hypothetical protein
LVPVALLLGALSAQAAPIIVTFDNDPVFSNQANPFTSSDSDLVHFSDSEGQDLIIVNHPAASAGSNALGVFTDGDDSALWIDLDILATAIAMDIGNDRLDFSDPGDEAVLVARRGGFNGQVVGEARVVLNRNGVMDQTIEFVAPAGEAFDFVSLKYDVLPSKGLTEVIDNVTLDAIPEPSAALVFGLGASLFGATLERRRSSGKELRGQRG